MANTILKIKGLKTYFYSEDRIVPAVDGVDLEVREGETLGIVGESGCGKSVTSLSVMRLIKYPGKIIEGEIKFGQKDLLQLTDSEMRDVRGDEISMIFQEPMTALNPVYSIGNQMMEMTLTHYKVSKQEAWDKAVEMLKTVSIPRAEEIMSAHPFELSGGMRQRVMIAMAMTCNPKIMIADEPTTALDVTIQAQILELMREMQDKYKTAIIFITHDLGVIAEMAKYVVVMYAGRIIEEASVDDIFNDPKHPYTIGLHDSTPKLDHAAERLESIPGMVPNLANKITGCAFKTRCKHVMERCCMEMPDLIKIDEKHKVRCWLHQK